MKLSELAKKVFIELTQTMMDLKVEGVIIFTSGEKRFAIMRIK